MEKTQLTVAELSSLLRMIQIIPDADSVGRIHHMLLAFCTAWTTIGVRRAFLLLVDERGRMIRGHLASEQAPAGEEPATSFEMLARRVVDSTRRIETSDLTLKTRTFTVPLDWLRCAAVKAATTGIPVLADRRHSEFTTDPFFDFFDTSGYLAVPLRTRGTVTAVLAADHGGAPTAIGVEDISLVYSMAQQAATAIDHLYEAGDNARKFRVLRKLQDILASTQNPRRFGDSLSAMLSIISRAIGGNGALLKDLVRNKLIHVKSVEDADSGDREADIALTEVFDAMLERVAGSVKPVRGDSGHALLNDAVAGSVQHFVALPLVAGGECLGAVVVYSESNSASAESREFSARDRLFLELSAGMLAERLDSLYKRERLVRSEHMLDEVQSHLVRERATSRVGLRAQELYEALLGRVQSLRETFDAAQSHEQRVARASQVLALIEGESAEFQQELTAMKSSLHLVDLFALTRAIADEWAPALRERGVEATVRIPDAGPVLLMDRDSIDTALRSVLRVLAAQVADGDRVLIECTTTPGKAVILIADTAASADGTLLSRLFMPFSSGDDTEDQTALSAAGDIIQRHAGEITVKSSPSWRTILGISFPSSANSDRRRTPRERRRRADRRHGD